MGTEWQCRASQMTLDDPWDESGVDRVKNISLAKTSAMPCAQQAMVCSATLLLCARRRPQERRERRRERRCSNDDGGRFSISRQQSTTRGARAADTPGTLHAHARRAKRSWITAIARDERRETDGAPEDGASVVSERGLFDIRPSGVRRGLIFGGGSLSACSRGSGRASAG